MNEQELRLLVRDAIARQMGTTAHSAPVLGAPLHHFSHTLFVVPSGADSEGPCVIEPSAMCDHCGYCKSYGH